MATRRWRIEKRRKAAGTYSLLVTGRDGARQFLGLGYLTVDEADSARTNMQHEEDAGRADRIIELHRKDQAAAVRALVGHPGLVDLLPKAPIEYGKMPLGQYVDEVFGKVRAKKKPKSWRTESSMWKRIKADLGDTRLADITDKLFLRWVRDLQIVPGGGDRSSSAATAPREPRAASGQYKSHLRMTLQACLTYAYIEDHLEEAVRLGALRIEGSTERVRVKPDPLTLVELLALLDASEPKHRTMWAVAAGEGLRPSELRRLEWTDVRWDSRTLMLRGDEAGLGKTALSVDEIPLTPLAFRELREWWVANGQPTTGPLFTSGKLDEDGRPLPYKSVTGYKRALEASRKAAKITRQVNPYLLRDSFATICWSIGVDKDTCRRILRHADEAMLDRIYCRPRPADLVERVKAFDRPA